MAAKRYKAIYEGRYEPDLRLLRRLLDQRSGQFFRVPELQKAAQLLCPCECDGDSVRALMQLAVKRLGKDPSCEAAALLYGLVHESEGQRLGARRKLAASKAGAKTVGAYRTNGENKVIAGLSVVIEELMAEHSQPDAA